MKARVKLSQTVTLSVEGASEESIYDWMRQTTPQEALEQVPGNYVDVIYEEDIICPIRDDSFVDLVIE